MLNAFTHEPPIISYTPAPIAMKLLLPGPPIIRPPRLPVIVAPMTPARLAGAMAASICELINPCPAPSNPEMF